MAKRRKTVKRATTRRRASKLKSKSGGLSLGGLMKPLSAVGYGFARDKLSDMISKTGIAKRLPATEFTDEGLMLGSLFLARKLGLSKNKIAGSLIRSAEVVEWARVGETLSNIQQKKKSGTDEFSF